MGQCAALYRVKKPVFKQIEGDPSYFKIDMTEENEIFDQNFEGLLFVLAKSVIDEFKERVIQIFYPSDYVGEGVDYESRNFDNLEDDLIFENKLIRYLAPKFVEELKELLNSIEKVDFMANYDSKELNENGIYPGIWKDDEVPDQAFNKRHLEEGFDSLQNLFNRASVEGDYILAFVG
ncbi:DUF1877 family protein [Aureivirga sp. CE67]|uniref:DUF1877 family protein n=1 Tax=Aureivirga sp. CE67 TaxID=1788983 RepID=UPI001E42A38A|nr:DUF1877 family protein [Aureivirga sp. CE67]